MKLVEEIYSDEGINSLIKEIRRACSNNLKANDALGVQQSLYNKLEQKLHLEREKNNSTLKKIEEIKKKYQ